jgi:hypothetical protein
MKNTLIIIVGLMFFSSVISIISPDKKNARLVNIVIISYIILVFSGSFKNYFSNTFKDYSGFYNDMIEKISNVADRNNKLITEISEGME